MYSLLKPGEFSLSEAKRRITPKEDLPDTAPLEVSAPEVDLGTLRESAFQEGYLQGLEAGRRDASAEIQSAREEAARIIEEAEERSVSILEEAKPAVLDLALDIAQKILAKEVSLKPEVLLQIADAALARVKGEESVVLRVNPRDTVIAEEGKPSLLEANPELKAVCIEADSLIEPGGCIVEGQMGSVDATLEAQMERVRRALRGGQQID